MDGSFSHEVAAQKRKTPTRDNRVAGTTKQQ
jgi:hypothetical protein